MKRFLVIALAGLMSVGLLAAGVQGKTSVKEHAPATRTVKKSAVRKHHTARTSNAKVKPRTHEGRPAAKRSKTTKHVAGKQHIRHETHVRHSKKGMHSTPRARTTR